MAALRSALDIVVRRRTVWLRSNCPSGARHRVLILAPRITSGATDVDGNLLTVWDDTDIAHLVAVTAVDHDDRMEIVVYNRQSSQIEVWGMPWD